jgi:hypothetical protein
MRAMEVLKETIAARMIARNGEKCKRHQYRNPRNTKCHERERATKRF